MIKIEENTTRRMDRRFWYLMGVVFVLVLVFTFLVQKYEVLDDDAGAANLAGFDPGYIISDSQMSNYNSMNESQIWSFLKSKNNCWDTDLGRYTAGDKVSYFSEMSPPRTWHIMDGHFVCMADEVFDGGTAAHIIYQAAQDYRINPQVLLVLLEKEQSLVTDTFPHSQQYRSATGYGCPDTAACSSQYFGLNNQIRNAAALFRTVLDGGWTNYPVGNNYIQYNPSASCGGSVVYIRNLATSALYRYTPYQPNSATLAGWSDGCNAYGNLNFYKLFEDWFGGITYDGINYVPLDTPRFMIVKNDVYRINPRTNMQVDIIEEGRILKFESKVVYRDGTSCLRTAFGTKYNEDLCIYINNLGEINLNYNYLPKDEQRKIIKDGAKKYYIRGENVIGSFDDAMVRKIVATTEFNGKYYGITEYDYKNTNSENGFLLDDVRDAPKYSLLNEPLSMIPKNDIAKLDLVINKKYSGTISRNKVYNFGSYTVLDGVKYYRTIYDTEQEADAAISENDLTEVNFVSFDNPRTLIVIRDVERINPITGELIDIIKGGRVLKFVTKIFINNEWYYRTEHNTDNNICAAIPADSVKEIE